MFIVEVIPLTSLPVNAPQILSYFFHRNLEKGAIVEINIHNRKTLAAVISSNPVEQFKISLKKSDFQLKKITEVVCEKPQIANFQFQIAVWLAKTYYALLGLSLKSILPGFYFKKKYLLDSVSPAEKVQAPGKPEILISRAKETLKNLKPEISRTIASGKQVLIITPDKTVAENFYKNLAGAYPAEIITSGQSNQKQFESWKKISSGEAKAIVGTRSVLFFPFQNLGLLILEDSQNEVYKSDMTPKYNTPLLAQKVSEIYGAKIIFTEQNLSVSEFNDIKEKRAILRERGNNRTKIEFSDLTLEFRQGNFAPLSVKLKRELAAILENNGKVLIFVPRRGFSGAVICRNCGLSVKCPNCDIPMRLHLAAEFFLICHRCNQTQNMPEKCLNCGSSNLKPTGPAGSQKIYDELRVLVEEKLLKKVPVLILDSDVIKNEIEEQEIIDELAKPAPLIIIATQMIFSHRYDYSFGLIGITNIDALSVFNDFRAEEETINQTEKLKDFEPEKIIIQTYNLDSNLNKIIENGDYEKFYEDELTARKIFGYPPFARLAKLTFRHPDKQKTLYAARLLTEKLKQVRIQLKIEDSVKFTDTSLAFIGKEKNIYSYNLVIKFMSKFENIKDFLKFVSPGWSIDVDPVRII